jgi:hypothetical protein
LVQTMPPKCRSPTCLYYSTDLTNFEAKLIGDCKFTIEYLPAIETVRLEGRRVGTIRLS